MLTFLYLIPCGNSHFLRRAVTQSSTATFLCSLELEHSRGSTVDLEKSLKSYIWLLGMFLAYGCKSNVISLSVGKS